MFLSIKKRRGYAAEFTGQHGHFFPIVKIESKEVQLLARFVVDTGATLCSIPAEAAEYLNLRPVRVDKGINTAVQYAELPVVILERAELLNTELSVGPLEAYLTRFLAGYELPFTPQVPRRIRTEARDRKVDYTYLKGGQGPTKVCANEDARLTVLAETEKNRHIGDGPTLKEGPNEIVYVKQEISGPGGI